MELFDLDSFSWSDGQGLNSATTEAAYVVHNDLLYFIGGRTNGGLITQIFTYDHKTDQWTLLPYQTSLARKRATAMMVDATEISC